MTTVPYPTGALTLVRMPERSRVHRAQVDVGEQEREEEERRRARDQLPGDREVPSESSGGSS